MAEIMHSLKKKKEDLLCSSAKKVIPLRYSHKGLEGIPGNAKKKMSECAQAVLGRSCVSLSLTLNLHTICLTLTLVHTFPINLTLYPRT